MTVILAATGANTTSVLSRLTCWSAGGYVEPFIWVDVDGHVTLAERGQLPRLCNLNEALQGRADGTFLVGVALPDANGSIGDGALRRLADVQAQLEAALPALVFPAPASLLFPLADTTHIERPPETASVRSTLVVLPEDQPDSREASQLQLDDKDVVTAHVAHAVACLTGIFGTGSEAFMAPAPTDTVDTSHVTFVRCHSRVIDAGFLADALTARAFTSARDGWPNPDMQTLSREGFTDAMAIALADRYFDRHRSVLGLRPIDPIVVPETERLSLLAALKAIARFLANELRRRPYEWFDSSMERLWDGVVVSNVERLGSGSDVRVVRWKDRVTSESAAEFMAAQIPKDVPAPDGAFGPAWRDLSRLVTGLIDGLELPFPTDEMLVYGQHRIVETRPSQLVPDPSERPPAGDSALRACDPLRLEPLITAALSGRSMSTQAGSKSDQEDGSPDNTPTEGALDEGHLAQIGSWYDNRKRTLLWLIGQRLASAMSQAEAESVAPVAEEWQALDKQVAQNRQTQRDLGRRRRRWSLLRTIATGALTWWLVVGHVPLLLKPVGVFVVFVCWVVLLIRSWKVTRSRRSDSDIELQRSAQMLVGRAVIAATRRGDLARLNRRYAEYLDWSEIIGHLTHRPWAPRRTAYGRAEDLMTPPDVSTLPAACKVGYALFSDDQLRRVSASAETKAFRPGWLTGLVDGVIKLAQEDWRDVQGVESAPDPYGDANRDPENIREHVRLFVARGDGRTVNDGETIENFLADIATEPVTTVLPDLTDAANSSLAPLAPAPGWFEHPKELELFAEKVRPQVIGLYVDLPGKQRQWVGSGVLLAGGLAATCRHCVEEHAQAKFEVATDVGQYLTAELVAMAPDADIALLRVRTQVSLPTALLGASVDLLQGSPIFTLGHPFFPPDSGGSSVSWGVVTATHRTIETKYAIEPRIQTNYPAGGGASGSPVFSLNGELVGIHTGGYTEPGNEGRSSHISLAVPVERLRALIAEAGGAEEVALRIKPVSAIVDGDEQFGLWEFLGPLLDHSSSVHVGAHGALSTSARRVEDSRFSPATIRALRSDTDLQTISLRDTIAQPLHIGQPLRLVAIRVDSTATFSFQDRSLFERLPFGLGRQPEPTDDERDDSSFDSDDDYLDSI